MSYKLKSSQSVDCLTESRIDLHLIIEEVKRANKIPLPLREEILKNIEAVVGTQETEWISNNGVSCLVD